MNRSAQLPRNGRSQLIEEFVRNAIEKESFNWRGFRLERRHLEGQACTIRRAREMRDLRRANDPFHEHQYSVIRQDTIDDHLNAEECTRMTELNSRY